MSVEQENSLPSVKEMTLRIAKRVKKGSKAKPPKKPSLKVAGLGSEEFTKTLSVFHKSWKDTENLRNTIKKDDYSI